jgi:hypothetical protein
MTDAPADNDAAFHQIYDDLVRKHNLSSPAYLAIARSLAALLLDDTGDPVTSARAIGKLTDLLPDAPLKPVVNKIIVELLDGRPLRNEDGSIRPWDKQDDLGKQAMIDQHWDELIPPEALAPWKLRKAAEGGAEIVDLVPPTVSGDTVQAGPTGTKVTVHGTASASPPRQETQQHATAPAAASEPMLAQNMTDEQKAERMKQLRAAAGDTDQPLRIGPDGTGGAGRGNGIVRRVPRAS